MSTCNRVEFDVIVIGGGPAGSTAASFIADQGHKVLLLEKDKYPKYKIGESLLPATVHGICSMLGVSEELARANFVTKLGGTFRWGNRKEPWTFYFGDSTKLRHAATALQVERMKFDQILLNNARKKGVDVREQCRVTSPLVGDGRVEGVAFLDSDSMEKSAFARYVVDASGHEGIFMNYAGPRVYSQFFQNIALFAYYLGGSRLPAPNQGNIFSIAFEDGWFWYIPLSETLTSVGVVFASSHSALLKQGHESALNGFIKRCGPIRDMLSNAKRVQEGPYGAVRVRKDYSYCSTKFWTPGLVLIGDSACFVDPVFSSGVHLATYSALLAARSINSCLRNALDEERAFTEFEMRYRREYAHFYDFLLAFYDMNQEVDSYFWHARRVLNSPERDNTAFINLVAGAETGEQLYANAQEFFDAKNGLGQLLFSEYTDGVVETGDRAIARREQFYRGLLAEVGQVQLQAQSKNKRTTILPITNGGLVPSPDGFHWEEPPVFVRGVTSGLPKMRRD